MSVAATETANITLCDQGARVARRLAERLGPCRVYVHDMVAEPIEAERFAAVVQLTGRIFSQYKRLVYIAPCGVVVRAIAPCIRHKLTDPAVVVTDVGGRHAVSLLSGHEGGANQLALEVANALGAEPWAWVAGAARARRASPGRSGKDCSAWGRRPPTCAISPRRS